MNILIRTIRIFGVLTIAVAVTLVLFWAGSVQARIEGITGPSFSLTAKAGEISTPDGGSVHFYGYGSGGELPQYPGPTLIVNEGDIVIVTLASDLPFGQAASIVFPGQEVSIDSGSGGVDGLLTRESTGLSETVTYTFTASHPGTYTYHSGTNMDLQVEMGMVGALIVRPNAGSNHAYNHSDTYFDHEYLFFLTDMDPVIHQLAEQGRFDEIDSAGRYPVYWFINGRNAPDTLADAGVSWLPHQPYNCTPRMVPGEKMLMRIIGAGQDLHPFHFHGNHAKVIAVEGRVLSSDDSASGSPDLRFFQFTTMSVPGETVDQIFEWTGAKLGWDIYGTPVDGRPEHNCIDGNSDGYADESSDYPWEWCEDHNKPFPVVLPEQQNLAFGGWWSGSPFMGDVEPLPPGEGGLNPFGGFFFMWHSHTEKEMTNFDIFPGGMMTMMVVEPPGTLIP